MIFNSISFLVFFIVFFIVYWVINNRLGIKTRNIFTIIASYIFYGLWDWRFLGLIIISSFTDYIIGLSLHSSNNKKKRKILLLTSLFINLGILAFFKYFNFFIGGLNELVGTFGLDINTKTLNIILPVGISFYTFQTLSYTIDIYKNKLKPTKDIISFFAFVCFFPQLVAGPIERASNLLKQFQVKKTFSYNLCISGLRLTLWGFFKKIVIADNFGYLSDQVFSLDANISGLTVIIGSIFFALQIYADFSGYSDIAIGISKMLGYDLMTNFRSPYFSKSFREFWQRWHISLSSWFKDYVYIPLGGNKKTEVRTYINLLITFLLSGLWHGANITFIIWGGLHAIFLIIERKFKLYKLNYIYYPFVLIFIILLWLPFRADDFSQLVEFSQSLISFSAYSFDNINLIISEYSSIRFISLLAILSGFIVIEYFIKDVDFNIWISTKPRYFRHIIYYLLIILILIIGNFSVKPNFIYFQF